MRHLNLSHLLPNSHPFCQAAGRLGIGNHLSSWWLYQNEPHCRQHWEKEPSTPAPVADALTTWL